MSSVPSTLLQNPLNHSQGLPRSIHPSQPVNFSALHKNSQHALKADAIVKAARVPQSVASLTNASPDPKVKRNMDLNSQLQAAAHFNSPINQDTNMMGIQHESETNPPPKKTRTNTPWTPEEEKRLKELRDVGTSWSEIAKSFPNRTEGSVKKHWYKDMHYAEFTEDEKNALFDAIREYDANKWKSIGNKVGKPAKACEQFARENFNGR